MRSTFPDVHVRIEDIIVHDDQLNVLKSDGNHQRAIHFAAGTNQLNIGLGRNA